MPAQAQAINSVHDGSCHLQADIPSGTLEMVLNQPSDTSTETAKGPPRAPQRQRPPPPPPSPALQVPAAAVTAVTAADQLQDASQTGQQDIEIQDHLDLRVLGRIRNPANPARMVANSAAVSQGLLYTHGGMRSLRVLLPARPSPCSRLTARQQCIAVLLQLRYSCILAQRYTEEATKAWRRQGTQQIKEHLQSLTLGVLQQECVATALHGQVEDMPGPAREHKRPPEMQAEQCVMAV